MFIICLYVYYYVYFIIMLEARAATYDYKELNEFITIVKKDYLPECICRTILWQKTLIEHVSYILKNLKLRLTTAVFNKPWGKTKTKTKK